MKLRNTLATITVVASAMMIVASVASVGICSAWVGRTNVETDSLVRAERSAITYATFAVLLLLGSAWLWRFPEWQPRPSSREWPFQNIWDYLSENRNHYLCRLVFCTCAVAFTLLVALPLISAVYMSLR